MSILSNASRGVYTPGTETQIGGMFPIWLDASKTFRRIGAIIDMNSAIGTGTAKVSAFYPSHMRTGTMIHEMEGKKAQPIPIYRVVSAVSASDTKVILQQGYGLPLVVKGTKLQNFAADPDVITANTININADGNAEVTITAGALGTLKAGDYLILEAAANLVPHGLMDEGKEYKGADLANTSVEVVIVDGGRIDEPLCAGVPFDLWSKYLQTIKLG